MAASRGGKYCPKIVAKFLAKAMKKKKKGLKQCNSNHSVASNPYCWISQGKMKALPHKQQALIKGNTKIHSLGRSYYHVIARCTVWLFLRGSINPLCEYNNGLDITSPVDGHLGCIQFLPSTNGTAYERFL